MGRDFSPAATETGTTKMGSVALNTDLLSERKNRQKPDLHNFKDLAPLLLHGVHPSGIVRTHMQYEYGMFRSLPQVRQHACQVEASGGWVPVAVFADICETRVGEYPVMVSCEGERLGQQRREKEPA